MHKVKFSRKNFLTQDEAYKAWEFAKKLLERHHIPYTIDVRYQELYITTEFTGKLEWSHVYSITFERESDMLAYELIKE